MCVPQDELAAILGESLSPEDESAAEAELAMLEDEAQLEVGGWRLV